MFRPLTTAEPTSSCVAPVPVAGLQKQLSTIKVVQLATLLGVLVLHALVSDYDAQRNM